MWTAEQARIDNRSAVINWLLANGWTPDGAGLVKDELRVGLSGDSGYVWALREFMGGEIGGVACRLWLDTVAEGDTLEDLLGALNRRVIEASERESDARERRGNPLATEDDWNDRSEVE